VWIRKLSVDELVRRLEPFVPAEWDRQLLKRIVPHIQERMKTLKDAKDQIAFLFAAHLVHDGVSLTPKKRDAASTIEALATVTVPLRYAEPFTKTTIESALHAAAQERGWPLGDMNMAVRVAVTGRTIGPPLYESLEILGKDKTLERIEQAQEILGRGVV
jgi:glutamyl-tRNA synthetase